MSLLIVKFTNNSGLPDTDVSIGFVPGASGDAFTITNSKDGSALEPLNISKSYPFPGNWYRLDMLSSGVEITSFSGRIYVAYNTPWTVQYGGYEPAQTISDPNFFLRYDKMEITFTGSQYDVANLTSIDYWSIPITLDTFPKTTGLVQTVYGLLNPATAQDVFNGLNALTTPPTSGINNALPALVPGTFPNAPTSASFARIIGPSSYPPINPPPGGVPITPYNTLQDYLKNLLALFGPGSEVGAHVPTLGNGVIATIAGNFAGVGPTPPPSGPLSPQAYSLSASINSALDITLTGTLTEASSSTPIPTTMIYYAPDLLNPTGIYGGNTPYFLNGSVSGTNSGNDVYGWIGGDLFSGLNIGAVGSTTIDSGKMVGAMESHLWFKIPTSSFFAKMQPNGTNYNQWAATLAPLSQAYNFAYSDRFAPVFVSLNPAQVDTLVVTLESGMVTMT